MIASYLDSSINKRRLATANKLLELKYYANIMTERIIKTVSKLYVDITQSERNMYVKCQIQTNTLKFK